MAELRKLDPGNVLGTKIPQLQGEVSALRSRANAIAKTARAVGAPLPIPDVNEITKKQLEKRKDQYVNVAKKECLLFSTEVFSNFVADNPPPIDDIINKLKD